MCPTYHFFFFNDTATTEIYTLSLHDALPIWIHPFSGEVKDGEVWGRGAVDMKDMDAMILAVIRQRLREGRRPPRDVVLTRSEEHTSELQSQSNLVCRLLLEKKKMCHPEHDLC